MEKLHQVVLNILVAQDLDKKVLDYIDPWGKTLASIACSIRASYHHTVMATPGQDVFGKDIIFNLASVVNLGMITAQKQRQVNMENLQENARLVMYDYANGDKVHVEVTSIYHKREYKK